MVARAVEAVLGEHESVSSVRWHVFWARSAFGIGASNNGRRTARRHGGCLTEHCTSHGRQDSLNHVEEWNSMRQTLEAYRAGWLGKVEGWALQPAKLDRRDLEAHPRVRVPRCTLSAATNHNRALGTACPARAENVVHGELHQTFRLALRRMRKLFVRAKLKEPEGRGKEGTLGTSNPRRCEAIPQR